MSNQPQDYQGTIIEESLVDKDVLRDVEIISTKVEPVTERHETPWLKQWTLHAVSIPYDKAEKIAERLSRSLDENDWYADFRDDSVHYIIFRDKVFCIDRTKPEQYQAATSYGLAHGIPAHQLDFSDVFLVSEEKSQP